MGDDSLEKKELEDRVPEGMISRGIVEYIRRNGQIGNVVLYGENYANVIHREISGETDFNSEVGFDFKSQGIIGDTWHVDVDDLANLYRTS